MARATIFRMLVAMNMIAAPPGVKTLLVCNERRGI